MKNTARQFVLSIVCLLFAYVGFAQNDSTITAIEIDGNLYSLKKIVNSVGSSEVADNSITDAKLATGIDAVKISGGLVSNSVFDFLNGVTSPLQTQIDALNGAGGSSPWDDRSDIGLPERIYFNDADARIGIGNNAPQSQLHLTESGNQFRFKTGLKEIQSLNSSNQPTNLTFNNLFTEFKGDLYFTDGARRIRNTAGSLILRGSDNIDLIIGSGLTYGGVDLLAGGGSNNDSFTTRTLTDGYNFLSSDFTSGREMFIYEGATDITVIVPSTAASAGQKLQIWQRGTGTINVVMGAGQAGTDFSTADNSNPLTLTYVGGTIPSIEPIGNWIAYNANRWTQETFDASTGLQFGSGSGVSGGKGKGIGLGSPTTPANRSIYQENILVIGETYTVTIDAQRIAGTGNAYCSSGDTVVGNLNTINNTDQPFSFTFTAAGTDFALSSDLGTDVDWDNPIILNQ